MTKPVNIGVVLSSGGVRGIYAHTGFLLALKHLGIPVSAISGCSAGAVVGGVVASGTDLSVWSEHINDAQPRRFWTPDAWPRLLWRILFKKGAGFSGISGTEAAIAFCREQLAVQNFEQCELPFYALAVNLESGAKTVFSSGELAPRLVASAAMPLFYRPVEIDGEFYCDGAMVELAPTDAICCTHKLDLLIIHHVSQRYKKRRNFRQAMQRPWAMLELMNRLLYRQRPWYLSDEPLSLTQCPCGCGARVMVVEPDLPILDWPLTRGGKRVQDVAMGQTEALLQPHLDALLTEPRSVSAESISEQTVV
ncbi:MAG: patatin-like phospholipase family protein [Gammaproteobacteria bacterium]|nr:patatin-like phospholipase family protein [Gammaproteobacteria bacterium]